MKRILITATSAMAHDFFIPHIVSLLAQGYEVEFAYSPIGEYEQRFKDKLKKSCPIPIYSVSLCRNPFRIINFKGYREMKNIIEKGNYNLIHTNEPVMGVVTRLAARKFRKRGGRVIYMAHGFHFFKGAPILNWLLYYPIERLLSKYTDIIIAINKEDYERAKSWNTCRVAYIPGVGLDCSKFVNVNIDRAKRIEIGVPEDAIMLLSVGELTKRKNHDVIIKAISKIDNPSLYYIICGQGPLRETLLRHIAKLKLSSRVILAGYRSDIVEICKCADGFVFPSKQEGLSVALMEAMAAGLPVICSRIRGNVDMIENGKGGYLCDANDVAEFVEKLVFWIKNISLWKQMGENNRNAVIAFDIQNSINEMKNIYNIIQLEN